MFSPLSKKPTEPPKLPKKEAGQTNADYEAELQKLLKHAKTKLRLLERTDKPIEQIQAQNTWIERLDAAISKLSSPNNSPLNRIEEEGEEDRKDPPTPRRA
jgi:hypothetical protein